MLSHRSRYFLCLTALILLVPVCLQGNEVYKPDSLPAKEFQVIPLTQPHAIDTIIHLPETTEEEFIETITPPEEIELPRSVIPWFTRDQLFDPFAIQPQFVDTTLAGFQQYDFGINGNIFFAHKGNPGHANRSLVFNPDFSTGIKFGLDQIYRNYLFSHEDIRFYRPRHVFTELFFVTGADREQLFYAKHAQKLSEAFNMSFKYRIINSPGSFSRLGARNANFYFTTDYLSKNERYQALASFTVNRIFNHESGGLKNPVGFAQDQLRDSIFLENAQSRYREISINLVQFYRTGINIPERPDRPSRFINLGRLSHSFTYQRSSVVFEDQNAPYRFFDFVSPNPLSTFDSTVIHTIKNRFSYSNAPLQGEARTFPFNLTVFLQHNHYKITQPFHPEVSNGQESTEQVFHYSDDSFDQVVQGVELSTDEERFLSLGGYYNVTLGGYNDQDIHAGAHLNLGRAGRDGRFRGMVRFASIEPPYFFSRFTSNFVSWDRDFSKMQILNLNARFSFRNITLEANNYLINNSIFFNHQALPEQNQTAIGFFDLRAKGDIDFGRFGLRNQMVIQRATTQAFESFPTFISHHSLFMNLALFQQALVTQLGFDFYFNTDYYAMSYMPVTRSFFAQDKQRTDNFVIIDAYLNAKIKRTRLFLKYQNISGLITHSPPQYYIPFHPLPESMFKFGVSWMFYD